MTVSTLRLLLLQTLVSRVSREREREIPRVVMVLQIDM